MYAKNMKKLNDENIKNYFYRETHFYLQSLQLTCNE